MVHPRLIVLNASGSSSSRLTLCVIETRSQEHVNLYQSLFLWLIQHQCQFTESVEKNKRNRKRKEEGEKSIAQCKKNFIKIRNEIL